MYHMKYSAHFGAHFSRHDDLQPSDAQVLLTLEDELDFAHEAVASKSTAGWLPVGMEEEEDTTPTDLFFRLRISRCGCNHISWSQ